MVRESRDASATSLLGTLFSSFLVRDVKRRIRRDRDKGVAVIWACRRRQTENAFFLLLHVISRSPYISLFGHSSLSSSGCVGFFFCSHSEIYVRLPI